MGVQAPLQVRLLAAGSTFIVTREVMDDVQIRNVVPGGFASCQVRLSRPLGLSSDELAPYAGLDVIDTRSGAQVFLGRLESPGRTSDGGGIWELAATGPSAHLDDLNLPVIYNDARQDKWQEYEAGVTPSGTIGTAGDTADPDDPGTLFAFPRGTVLAVNSRKVQRYDLFRASGQHLARAAVRTTGGRTLATLEQNWVGRGGPAADAVIGTRTLQTGSATMLATPLPSLYLVPELRFFDSGVAATVADDVTWNMCQGTRVLGTRLTRYGVEDTAAASYPQVWVLPHPIVEDVLGRFLPEFDIAQAQVDTTSAVQITQLAYEDGTTARGILDDLMALVPTHYYAAWESPRGLGARFEWQPWPTEVSLDDLDVRRDKFSSPGSQSDLFNAVTVRYKTQWGHSRSVSVTATSPALSAAGLTRRALLDLGSQAGDKAQAQTAGAAFLAAHKYPVNAGTVVVNRPVRDVRSGRRLQPWEIRAGVLCRVQGVQPYLDWLNPRQDGASVFRVSEVSYSARSGEATLSLDSYGQTVAKALARLARATGQQRRL